MLQSPHCATLRSPCTSKAVLTTLQQLVVYYGGYYEALKRCQTGCNFYGVRRAEKVARRAGGVHRVHCVHSADGPADVSHGHVCTVCTHSSHFELEVRRGRPILCISPKKGTHAVLRGGLRERVATGATLTSGPQVFGWTQPSRTMVGLFSFPALRPAKLELLKEVHMKDASDAKDGRAGTSSIKSELSRSSVELSGMLEAL